MDNAKSIISWGDALQPYCYVFHPSAGPIFDKDREKRLELLENSMKELQAFTKTPLAVENMPRTGLGRTVSEMQELISHDDRLRVCFDVNHLLCDDHKTFWNMLKEKIVTLHISDYDFIDEFDLICCIKLSMDDYFSSITFLNDISRDKMVLPISKDFDHDYEVKHKFSDFKGKKFCAYIYVDELIDSKMFDDYFRYNQEYKLFVKPIIKKISNVEVTGNSRKAELKIKMKDSDTNLLTEMCKTLNQVISALS